VLPTREDPNPMSIKALACTIAGGTLSDFEYEPAELGPRQVLVDITHCGICHSDIHLIDNDWGVNRYPLVPGHEIIGTVREGGAKVTGLRLGQRVGIGWQRGSCGKCEWCKAGEENLCTRLEATCVGHHGGFADAIIVDARFAFPIPDALDSAHAAPLLCAGVTTFAPLRRHGVGPGTRVGIIGVGGLGHLAIQFAKAMGAEVTALSSTAEKIADARELGAAHFIDTRDGVQLRKASRSFDFLLNTVSAPLELQDYLSALKPGGTLCVVGAPREPIMLPPTALIGGQKSLTGSAIGGTRVMREMLDFAAQHGIRARINALPMHQANLAIAKVRRNQARYRMVLGN
jgi:uncharacterized zinc-type alcohol dehydrogenase-like protein